METKLCCQTDGRGTCVVAVVCEYHGIFVDCWSTKSIVTMSSDDYDASYLQHLDWTAKQGRILTGNNILSKCYQKGRDFEEEDLPHHHKSKGTSHTVFRQWAKERRSTDLIAGSWSRPLFSGGWEEDGPWATRVKNVQTPTLFIDMRIPRSRPEVLKRARSLDDLNLEQLRLLSRQHCFAGYSLVDGADADGPVCIRHHSIDWNPSPRRGPNKWRIDLKPDRSTFKEFCYATDKHGQAVYMERWQRMEDSDGPFLAMRKLEDEPGPDTILVIAGNHFSYIRDRRQQLPSFDDRARTPSLAQLVDEAVEAGNKATLCSYLDVECSAGVLMDIAGFPAWLIELSTFPWLEGKSLLSGRGPVRICYDDQQRPSSARFDGCKWEILTCTFTRAEVTRKLGVMSAKL